MISDRKKYLIQLFIKKAIVTSMLNSSINCSFQLLENTYPHVSSEDVKKLREKFTLDDFIERVTPVIDRRFAVDELLELIKFYSSSLGKKVINPDFFKDMQETGNNLFREIEQEFAIKNGKEKTS